MKTIIRRILKIFGLYNIVCHIFNIDSKINKIWYEDGEIYIHTNCRSGLFYLPIQKGELYAYFFVDIMRVMNNELPKDETIYMLTDIRDKKIHKKLIECQKQKEEQK